MPQKKQAKKDLRKTKTRTVRNKAVKDSIDYLLRQFKKAITASDKAKATEFAKKLTKAIDKAAKKNIFHKNNAARKKSGLIKKLNGLK
ncbi:MAG: 30S ribosomal protein S20 [Patescibacteria group bacterium]